MRPGHDPDRGQRGALWLLALLSGSIWGNQVWFGLLLAFAVGWSFVLPRARAQGVSPAPWAPLLIATGSFGLLAFAARVLWLEAQAGKR